MKKILGFATLSLALIFASCQEDEKQKAVLELVSAETVSVSATGGEQTIQVNSNSALTAKSSASWVTVAVKDNNTVTATVAAYDGADTRSATVTISNESELTPLNVRINQAAIQFDFNPKDYEFEAEGGSYSFPYTAETTLTAVADEGGEDWLTVNVTASEVVLSAAANEAVAPRESIVEWTIGSAKGEFVVSQKAAEATFEGNFENINAPIGGASVSYEYTTNSELEVNSEEDWIEVYTEDGKLYINVAANSGNAREGYVTWSVKGSDKLNGEITVKQSGSILTVNAYPYNYNAALTSASVCAVFIHTETLAKTIYISYFSTSYGVEDLTEEELIKVIKNDSYKDDFSENAQKCYTGIYGSLANFGTSIPADKIVIAAVYVNDGETEEVKLGYIHFTNGDEGKNWTLDQIQPVSNKSDYYGEYHLILSETDEDIDDFMDPDVYGNIYITDGEAAVLDNGQTVEQLKISGLLNQLFFQRYTFGGLHIVDFDDSMYFYYVNGYINSVDKEEFGPVMLEDGSIFVDAAMTLTQFTGNDEGLYSAAGATIGGVINDEGYIAFVGNSFDDEGLGDYAATWLYTPEGYLSIYRDVILVPTGKPFDQITVAAAQKKLARIKKEMRPVKGDGSYLLRSNYSFANALNKVNASEKNSNVVFSGNATLHTSL